MNTEKILAYAYSGDFNSVISLLNSNPNLIDEKSVNSGYSILHQAAWHGVAVDKIGQLLRFNPDLNCITINKAQKPIDIAKEKHGKREDLLFLLDPSPPTVSQVLRVARHILAQHFMDYDGNLDIFDALIPFFEFTPCPSNTSILNKKILSALTALFDSDDENSNFNLNVGIFHMRGDLQFWKEAVFPVLPKLTSTKEYLLNPRICVVSDLFNPAPKQWGLRGDLFLWAELHRALSTVALPESPEILEKMIHAALFCHTGIELSNNNEARIYRFQRGGMSSGLVSGEFWLDIFLPMVLQRYNWVIDTWD